MVTVTFAKPVTLGGEKVSKVDLDFDKITGMELLSAEKHARDMGDTTPSLALSMTYQALVASKVLGVPYDDVVALPAKAFAAMTLEVGRFLLD